MKKVIVNSVSMYKIIKNYIDIIDKSEDNGIILYCNNGKLYFEGQEKHLHVEAYQEFVFITTVTKIKGLLNITRVIQEQPLTLGFKDDYGFITIQEILI